MHVLFNPSPARWSLSPKSDAESSDDPSCHCFSASSKEVDGQSGDATDAGANFLGVTRGANLRDDDVFADDQPPVDAVDHSQGLENDHSPLLPMLPHEDPRWRTHREELDRVFSQLFPDPEECGRVVANASEFLGSLRKNGFLPYQVDRSLVESACRAYVALRTRLNLVYSSHQGQHVANRLGHVLRALQDWFETRRIGDTDQVFSLFLRQEFLDSNPVDPFYEQENVARRNRGYLEYLAFRRFVREQGHYRLESSFLEEVRRLESKHLLPPASHLNDFDFSDNGGL